MPKYSVVGVVRGSKYLGEFEAESKKAIEMALESEEAHVSLCHQCCEECEDPFIQSAEADALPVDAKERSGEG